MIRILGHRGGRNLWPENSLQGFRNAIGLGVDAVEFDVHLSADDEIVVIHDPTLERTTHGEGLVAQRTAAELGCTRLRGSEEGVPTFKATLDIFEGGSTGLFVEIKTDTLGRAYRGLEKRVLAAVAKRNMTARTTLVSFVPETLEAARIIEPSIGLLAPLFRATSQMLGGVPAMLERLERIPGCLISVQRDMLWTSREYFSERLPADRFCVGVTNDATELDYWMTQPVFQVGSDRPDLALAARQRHSR
ncbi:MAG: glycerophosphodiester phosphodiesterase family protein [Casimicrobiaceae bacterium]